MYLKDDRIEELESQVYDLEIEVNNLEGEVYDFEEDKTTAEEILGLAQQAENDLWLLITDVTKTEESMVVNKTDLMGVMTSLENIRQALDV